MKKILKYFSHYYTLFYYINLDADKFNRLVD